MLVFSTELSANTINIVAISSGLTSSKLLEVFSDLLDTISKFTKCTSQLEYLGVACSFMLPKFHSNTLFTPDDTHLSIVQCMHTK